MLDEVIMGKVENRIKWSFLREFERLDVMKRKVGFMMDVLTYLRRLTEEKGGELKGGYIE